jgi:hypothetical protein
MSWASIPRASDSTQEEEEEVLEAVKQVEGSRIMFRCPVLVAGLDFALDLRFPPFVLDAAVMVVVVHVGVDVHVV